jgi:hypothetical protein
MAYVLAIKSSELLAVGEGPAKPSAAQLAAAVPTQHWVGPAPATAPKAAGCTTGPASSCPHQPPADGSAGCWSGAAAATASWPLTSAPGRPAPHWWVWFGWPGPAG